MKKIKLCMFVLCVGSVIAFTGCSNSNKATKDVKVESTTEPTATTEDKSEKLESEIKSKDKEISELKSKVKSLETQVKTLSDANDALTNRINDRTTTESKDTTTDKKDDKSSNDTNSSKYTPNYSSTDGLSGVHDITVKVHTDYNKFIDKLIDGVSGNNNVTINTNNVNLDKVGSYKVKWMLDDKVEATCTVNVVKK